MTNNPDNVRLVERYAVVRRISLSTVNKAEHDLMTSEMKTIELQLEMDGDQIVEAHRLLFLSRQQQAAGQTGQPMASCYDVGFL